MSVCDAPSEARSLATASSSVRIACRCSRIAYSCSRSTDATADTCAAVVSSSVCEAASTAAACSRVSFSTSTRRLAFASSMRCLSSRRACECCCVSSLRLACSFASLACASERASAARLSCSRICFAASSSARNLSNSCSSCSERTAPRRFSWASRCGVRLPGASARESALSTAPTSRAITCGGQCTACVSCGNKSSSCLSCSAITSACVLVAVAAASVVYACDGVDSCCSMAGVLVSAPTVVAVCDRASCCDACVASASIAPDEPREAHCAGHGPDCTCVAQPGTRVLGTWSRACEVSGPVLVRVPTVAERGMRDLVASSGAPEPPTVG